MGQVKQRAFPLTANFSVETTTNATGNRRKKPVITALTSELSLGNTGDIYTFARWVTAKIDKHLTERSLDKGHVKSVVVQDRSIRWGLVAFCILLLPFLYFICPLLIEYLVPISPLSERTTVASVKLLFLALEMFASLRPLMKELALR